MTSNLDNLKIPYKVWIILFVLSLITIVPSSFILHFFNIHPTLHIVSLFLMSFFYFIVLVLFICLLYYGVFLKKIKAIKLYEELTTVSNYSSLLKHEITIPLKIIEKGVNEQDIKTCSLGLTELNDKLYIFLNDINSSSTMNIKNRLLIHYKSIYLHPPVIIWDSYNEEDINGNFKHNILVYLLILIDNALEAGSQKIIITHFMKDGYLYLNIKDNGHGIVDKNGKLLTKFNKIFEYSYSLKKILTDSLIKKKNTGCGLFLIKKQLESTGGNISVRENTSNGVTFEIKIKKR